MSVSNQTYFNWQLVIIDDGSNDESENICADFKQAHKEKCIILQSNRKQSGAGVCRNIGLQHCDGDFIVFLDSDDLLESFCLAQRVHAIANNDLAIFKQYIFTDNLNSQLLFFNGPANTRTDAIKAFTRMDPPWQTMAGIWKKEALEILNGFDKNLVFMEDPDIHLRALLNPNFKIIFCYDLPADNYYRINNMQSEKAFSFYKNSIDSRINFIEKLIVFQQTCPSIEKVTFKKNLKIGYYSFLRDFVMARFPDFKKDIFKLNTRLDKAKIITKFDKLKLKILFLVYSSNSLIVKKMRLKGIAYKLIS